MGPRLVHVPDEQEGRGCIRLWELHDQCGTNGDYGIAVAGAVPNLRPVSGWWLFRRLQGHIIG
jgi:hypothetical protein